MRNLLQKSISIIVVTMVSYNFAIAQADFSVNGLGRSILSDNSLKGNLLNDTTGGKAKDTLSTRKGSGGYNLFDLGFNFKKGKEFKTNAILRVKQPFGDFWGDLTKFEFRQLQIMGELRWLKYELGDIDVKMTPYTVFNADESYNKFESDIFKARRDIVEYENFNKNNVWRLQGIKLGTGLYFENKIVDEILIKGFAVRTRGTNEFTIPDRLLTSVSTEFNSFKRGTIGVNYVGYNDIKVMPAFVTDYANNLVTSNFDLKIINKDNFKLHLLGEAGFSKRVLYRYSNDSNEVSRDYFYDGGVKAKSKKGHAIKIAYKNVGLNYSSPSAQTTRVNIDAAPALFDKVNNKNTVREQTLFDRYSQETVYNRNLTDTLNLFNPIFNNTTPFGEATPNRQGITVEAESADSSNIKFFVQGRLYSEIVGEGTTAKRAFKTLTTGAKINLGKIIKVERPIDITLCHRVENTTRSAEAKVDLSTNVIDAGLVIGIFKQLDFMLGAKMLNSRGNEFLVNRSDLNNIASFRRFDVNVNQTTSSVGFKINFNETANLYVNYNVVDIVNHRTTSQNYTINQLFMNFNILF